MHIDGTFIPLGPGKVLVNPKRPCITGNHKSFFTYQGETKVLSGWSAEDLDMYPICLPFPILSSPNWLPLQTFLPTLSRKVVLIQLFYFQFDHLTDKQGNQIKRTNQGTTSLQIPGVHAAGNVQGLGRVRGGVAHPPGVAPAVLHQPVDGELQRASVGREARGVRGVGGAYHQEVRGVGLRRR